VAQALAEQGGIGVRWGCHCAHLLIKRLIGVSPALELFQGLMLTLFARVSLPGLVRVSLGLENSAEDVETLIQVLDRIARQPQGGVGRRLAATANGTTASPQAHIEAQMDAFARAAAQRVFTQRT
jgi:hypothetical protein